MNLPSNRRRPSGLLLFLMLLAFLAAPHRALALSAADLVVVFNANVPGSKTVADYYADKRKVPKDNLVGVLVPAGEDMSRQDYDQKLAPLVRDRVEKLKAQGKNPAVLLVYGIPLRVGGVAATKDDAAFRELAAAEENECQQELTRLVKSLDRITGASPPGVSPSEKLTYPPRELLVVALKAYNRGVEFLKKSPATPKETAAREEVMSLLTKLGGISPEAQALLARMARSPGHDRQALMRQELLGWTPHMREDAQEEAFRGILPQTAGKTAAAIRFTNGLIGVLKFWDEARRVYEKPQSLAAVDSEMTLIMAGPYQTYGWLPNPFNLAYDRLPVIGRVRARTLMVGRLDGPTPAIAKRLVDDALEAEKTGLHGVCYLDARGLTGESQGGNYVWFDQHLIRLYDLLRQYSDMKVVLDKKPEVFPPGSCPEAALYCGWYSLGHYVPAFTWVKGAVGYHVASSEATTLKQPGSQVWCKRMLEEGVAATLGPVTEPYLVSFPLPDQFFPLLMTGELPLLEVYFRTVPQVSWMQILIGDPLYQPFKGRPAIRPPTPRGAATPH